MFKKEKYKNKTVLIIGGGKSGVAIAKLLNKKLNTKVIISDEKNIKTEFETIKESEAKKIIDRIDFAVKSPGISPDNELIKTLIKNEIPIYSEIEVALSFSKTDNIVMITGTNGKSTTTYLTYLIFNNYLITKGNKAILCGNIGKPVSDEVLKAKKNDWLIIEISSYQLEDSTYIKPKIATILNITPDHIEHHKTMENYIKAKFKIFKNFDESNYLILNYDDKILRKIKGNFKIKFFSVNFSF